MDNTLLLGNGFTRSLYANPTDWGGLFADFEEKNIINNYTLLYEACVLSQELSDNYFKRRIADKLREGSKINDLSNNNDVIKFGDFLIEKKITNILTTNMDQSIENILCEKNEFKEINPADINKDAGEKIYSIRRKRTFKKGDFELNIWKIHGDNDNISSILFGFDQYCGQLAKMNDYLKGKYKSSSGIECKKTMFEKLKEDDGSGGTGQFDNLSWIELFFNTNIYIAGITLDYSEIDLWWLINKRKRLINELKEKYNIEINNKIYYLYNEYDSGEKGLNEDLLYDVELNMQIESIIQTYPMGDPKYKDTIYLAKDEIIRSVLRKQKMRMFEEKTALFDIFDVKCKKIGTGTDFLRTMFEVI